MKENYITLADYASSIGISIEEAAARVKTAEYKDYYKEIGGVALVSTSIPDYKEEEAATEEEISPAPPARDTGNTGGESPEVEEAGDTAAAEVERLRQEIEELRQSVKEKDAIIMEKDKQITDFALRFADLAQQAQIIAGQAQVLQAADKPKAIEAQATAAAHEEEQPKKKSFLKRLFG